MRTKIDRFTEISLLLTEISLKRAEIFPCDHFSLARQVGLKSTAHVQCFVNIEKMDKCGPKHKQRRNFRWESELIEGLIKCLLHFKTKIIFQCKDFDVDKPLLYSEIWNSIAVSYGSIFGPVKESVFSNAWSLAEDEKKRF